MSFGRRTAQGTSYGIIGLGRFGTALAIELASHGREILVIDADEDRIKQLREYTENAFVVHSLDKNTLLETGIQNCEVAVVCIGEQMDVSILTTLHLKGLGIGRVIAKAAVRSMGRSWRSWARRWSIRSGIWRFAWRGGWSPPKFSTISN